MKNNLFLKKTFPFICALTLVSAAFFVRRVYFFANAAAAGTEPFFTLESAMFFRYVRMIVSGAGLPVWDGALSYPEGLFAFKTFSLWAEYIYAGLARAALMLGAKTDLAGLLNIIIPAVFSFGAVFVFFALRALGLRLAAAFCGAAFYAVTLPAVIRSAGIEISNENAALPLLCLHLWLFFAWLKKPSAGLAAAAGAAAGLALGAWDLVQLYLGLFLAVFFFFSWRGREQESACRFAFWHMAGLLAVTVWSAYLLHHGFFVSFPFWLSAFFGLAALSRRHDRVVLLFWGAPVVLAVTVGLCVLGAGADFGRNYAHFAELLWVKLRHFNVRPADPAALSFSARLLWTPALHSAGFKMAVTFFARVALLCFAAFFSSTYVRRGFGGQGARPLASRMILALALVFGLLFFLFVRLHVFAALFFALLSGIVIDLLLREQEESGRPGGALLLCALFFPLLGLDALAAPGWALLLWFAAAAAAFCFLGGRNPRLRAGAVLFFALAGFVGAEAAVTSAGIGRWCRRFYYEDARRLFSWCAANTDADAVVLADFGLSPCVLERTGRRTVLHPKFETMHMRSKVEAWARALFSGDEEDFYGFCRKNRVDYYIHSRGTWSDTSPYSWRYITNTLSEQSSRDTLTCFKFEKRPEALRHFFQIYSSSKYDVFRVITPAIVRDSIGLTGEGLNLLDSDDAAGAREKFSRALSLYPYNSRACFGMSRALNAAGRTREGADYAKRALALMLGKSGRDTGRKVGAKP